MFNLQPGMGLGFSGHKEIAAGLNTNLGVIISIIDPTITSATAKKTFASKTLSREVKSK